MPRELTLGVLSPYLGGAFHGGILAEITRTAADANATVVAIQTLDPGTDHTALAEPPALAYPLAWEHTAGFIVIDNAVRPRYLAALRKAGKPVVTVTHEAPRLGCPAVLVDDGAGVRDAVRHLVGHGHRRIAFAGCLGAEDVRQRHAAYREALRAHGLVEDPGLVFECDDNGESGGEQAGRALLAAGLPSTAVVAGTDANAIGLMRVLTRAGHRLPDDQAVVGFDDMRAAAHVGPSLSTVRQPVDALGSTAVAVLLEALRGGTAGAGPRIPSTFAAGESCGCCGDTRFAYPVGAGPVATARDRAPTAALLEHLQQTLCTQHEVSVDLLRGHEDPRRLGWLARTSARAGCLGLWAEGRCGTHADPALDFAGTFVREKGPITAHPTTTGFFPPAELLALAGERRDDLVLVVPVKADGSDWGLLAVVDTVETHVVAGREPLNQWSALLTVALDHRAVLRELRKQEEQLRVAARYDHLTGLANRSLFLCRVDAAVATTQRRIAVLFLDLDGFKVVNDSMGHSVGDRLLIQVAERIKACLRESDLAARFGGDEFLILLDGIEDAELPTRVAERVHAALARPFHLHGQEVVATATIGIALSGPRYERAEDLVRDADIAMSWAKSRRKGSQAIFDVAMHAKAVSRLQIETELRRAIERDEFEVHYQPIVDLPSGQTHAFEALVRWRHPERGLVQPDDFLPIAEETGLIVPIGRRILNEACQRLAAWQRASGRPDLSISLNVSNRQFWHGGLVDDVAECLRRTRLDPHSLSLEITEGVIMHNVGLARKLLEDLHGLGCRLHIDDFGTGYSSLEALHRLPIDALKIDRSFVSGLGVDPRSGELVRTIVLMARNLGLGLIGEGIENTEQREHLLRLDCTYGQGYLLSRPVPAEPAAALLSRRH